MNEKDFKDKHKFAACNRPPWSKLIPKSIRGKTLAKIREECNEIYGRSFDECAKRLVCVGKNCIGRPLPIKSPTAKPYIEKLKLTHEIKDGELFLSNCDTCPIKKSCTSLCTQMNDYLHRDKKKEAKMIYKDKLDNLTDEKEDSVISLPMLSGYDIPWDCVSDRKQRVVRKYLFERKDFLTIAKQEGLINQARTKYEYYSALTKMSEYAVMRKFLENKSSEITTNQLDLVKRVYLENKNLAEVAKELDITRQAAHERMKRVRDRYRLTWHKFVQKKKIEQDGKKVTKFIYNIPEVLR